MENMTANYPGGLFLGKGAHKKKLETSAKGGGELILLARKCHAN